MNGPSPGPGLVARRMGIDTYQEPVVFLHADSPMCHAEGFEALARVRVRIGARSIVATLNVVRSMLIAQGEAGLSDSAWRALGAHPGDSVMVEHPEPLDSFSAVRAKIYGRPFSDDDLLAVTRDIGAGRYSAVELAAFVTACASQRMSQAETLAMTRAMVDTGTRLAWPAAPVVDKHCVGGLPGNRTTPIVVAIVAACGLTIPKTSSRAITSPAGTADAMETMAPVDLTLEHMRRVVEREGGCVVWGGAMALSPVDDILIRVERPLDFDSHNQIVASIISKKVAAGSTHLLVDIPVGPTAKLRDAATAQALGLELVSVGTAMGLATRVVQTDGAQPVGRGIGPALEARDVLAVLRGDPGAPSDLRQRSIDLAGHLLELGNKAGAGQGGALAGATLSSGAAWARFQAICEAQGGLREPPRAPLSSVFEGTAAGRVATIDNRRLSKAAKLAGAPRAPAAGLELHVRLGDRIEMGQKLFTLHAQSRGELAYASAFLEGPRPIVTLAPA